MDESAKLYYLSAMDFAEKIDAVLIKSKYQQESVQELLRMDIRDFLTFLIITDRNAAKDEIRYINKFLGYHFDNETFRRFAIQRQVMNDDFLNFPPASLHYFLEYSNHDIVIVQNKYYDVKKLYFTLFQSVGEDFLSNTKHMDGNEVNQLTRYLFMIKSRIRAYEKSGTEQISRPDTIPFVRKTEPRSEISQPELSQPDNPFIGNISGGTETYNDLDSLLAELDALIGLEEIKSETRNLINLLKIIELRKQNGLKTPPVTRHFIFTGNPGTGKTTVARLLSKIYCSLGILSKGHLVEVDRSGLVSGYMGQTAIKVKDVVEKAKGGVLFIDEAYSLANNSTNGDFGQEAIDTLVKAMEDNRDDFVVIVAGYPDLMKNFIHSNPGLKSRFHKTLHFKDYSSHELFQVFLYLCQMNDYRLDSAGEEYLIRQLDNYTDQKNETFGNARDMRNFLNQAISNQANRLLSEQRSDTDSLITLTIADLRPIFEGGGI